MCHTGLLLYLLIFWHTLQPFLNELAGNVVPYAGRTSQHWNYLLKRGRDADATRSMSALVALGPESRGAVATLREVLLHGPPWQRRTAALSLAQLGAHFTEATDALCEGMRDNNQTIRRAAYEGLARVDAPTLQRIAPELLVMLDEQPTRFRRNLIEALEQADLNPNQHLAVLQKMLTHDRSEVQKLGVSCFRKKPRQAAHVALIEPLLKEGSSELRNRTLQTLCGYAGEGKAPPAYLVQAIQSEEEDVRQAALDGMAELGSKAKGLESELLTALEQVSDGSERLAIAEALWRHCRHPKGKATVLHLWREGYSTVRLQAAMLLADVGRGEETTLEVLHELLLGKDARMERLPLRPFLLQQDAIFPLLEEALRDKRPTVRQKTQDILRDLPAAQRPRAASLLLRCCRTDPEPWLQYRAALFLWTQDRHPAAVEYLALLLEEDSVPQNLRRQGIVQLPVQGPLAPRTVLHLINALKSPEPNLRDWAAERLAGATVQVEAVTDALHKALSDKDADVREAAARSLRTLGPVARKAIPDLWRRLEDTTPGVQKEALLSLAALHPEPEKLLPHLLPFIGHYEESVQSAALEVLAGLKTPRQEALPHLRNLLRDKDTAPRRKALLIIDRLDLPDADAVRALVPALADADDETRSIAVAALGRRKTLPPAVQTQLRRMLLQEEGRTRLAAAVAVWRLDHHPLAMAILCNGLKDRAPDMPAYAADCLTQLGPDARRAAPALVPLLSQLLMKLEAEALSP